MTAIPPDRRASVFTRSPRSGSLLRVLAPLCLTMAGGARALVAQVGPLPADSAPALAVGEDSVRPPAVKPKHARRPRPIRFCAGGDVTLGSNIPIVPPDTSPLGQLATPLPPPTPPRLPSSRRLLSPLRPLVRDADVVLLNVEGAIGEGEVTSKCGPRSTMCFALRQPPGAATALRALNESAAIVGNVANNHSRDAGLAGFDTTLAWLARAGVFTTGADTLATPVVTRHGDTIAVLGFATSGIGIPDLRDLEAVRRHVARAAEQYARVVVTMHLGAEGRDAQRTRDTVELYAGGNRGNPVEFARTAVEAGADLVVGHGPHVMRAMEWRGDALVMYSLGNLVTYGPFSNRPPLDRGAVVCATLDRRGVPSHVVMRATRQHGAGWVARDRARRAAFLVDSLSRLDFPRTGARVRADGQVSRPPVTKQKKRKKATAQPPKKTAAETVRPAA